MTERISLDTEDMNEFKLMLDEVDNQTLDSLIKAIEGEQKKREKKEKI